MKIKSYKKIKNNIYRISFENNQNDILLFDDIILKFNLLVKKEVTKEELNKIIKENERLSCYYKAINYLTSKNRSKKEVMDYLKKQKFYQIDIDNTINILEEKKLINDEEYLKMFIRDQLNTTNNGPKKIKRKLLDLGLKEESIKNELNNVSANVWYEKLEKIITKKINANKKDGINKIKEKIIYSCTNEGFLKEDILSIIENIDIPKNDNALLKEAEKLYKKLSLKYNGSELFFQIKGRLLNKGFYYEDIDIALEDIKKSS